MATAKRRADLGRRRRRGVAPTSTRSVCAHADPVATAAPVTPVRHTNARPGDTVVRSASSQLRVLSFVGTTESLELAVRRRIGDQADLVGEIQIE